jgi:hypothetical protein
MKVVKTNLFGFLVVCLTLMAYLSVSAQDSSTPELKVSPEDLEVSVGENDEILIVISDADEINAFDIRLVYDPGVIELIDADDQIDGIQVGLGDFLAPDYVLINNVDESAGTIRVVMTQINPNQPQSGDGTLLVIQFTATSPNQETEIGFQTGVLAKGTGEEIVPVMTPGYIIVAGSGTVVPSRTPSPTTAVPTATRTDAINPNRTSTQSPSRTSTTAPASAVQPSRTPTRTPFPTAGPTNTPLPTSTSDIDPTQGGEPTKIQTTTSTSQDQVEIDQIEPEIDNDLKQLEDQPLSDTKSEEGEEIQNDQSDDSETNNGSQNWIMIAAEIVGFIFLVIIIFYGIRWLKSRNN